MKGPPNPAPKPNARPKSVDTMWICGQRTGDDDNWAFAGVFISEELAISACRDEFYFIGPAVVNNELPHEPCDWTGAYYPIAAQDTDK